jgi:predicted nucleotidyltransferase component of viral defense system
MIPQEYITEWSNTVPWQTNEQVEQDLIISRALLALFTDKYLSENLAFRGGTALHKLYLNPPTRYSENIDLVQIKKGRIKSVLKRISEVITFFEEESVVKVKANNVTLLYSYNSAYSPDTRLKLKIEINCKEHFNLLGRSSFPFYLKSEWFTGKCNITTYYLDELLGTKLRALYQRNKGRDLFDLYYASQHAKLDYDRIIHCYNEYMKFAVDKPPTQKEFLLNMELKKKSAQFSGDINGLLNPKLKYNQEGAFEWLEKSLAIKMV